jgi:predicted Co/Zn/Cd cation transporter (cation efflux family)
MSQAVDHIEKQALRAGAAINLVMAVSGWVAYYFSNAEALLLDGNFSLIGFFSTIAALQIAGIKLETSQAFPFGQFVYEALYALLKGLLVLGLIIMALTSNIIKLLDYLAGKPIPVLQTGPILIYTVFMIVLCFGTAFYLRHLNIKTNNVSTILSAEVTSYISDGALSAAAGVILFAIRFVSINGPLGFLHYIGDALMVILLCGFLLRAPFKLVKNSFIELAGGVLQDKTVSDAINATLRQHLIPEVSLTESYISKTGSSYIVVGYLNWTSQTAPDLGKLRAMKAAAATTLQKTYPHLQLETILV